MNELDDLPLVSDASRDDPHVQAAPARRGGPAPILVIAVLGVVLGGAAAWWWTRDRPGILPARASGGTDGVIAASPEPARALPPLDQMDTFLRALLGAISANPELARWLATDDLIRQMARGIDRVSRGLSPARELQVLHPKGEFLVIRRAGQTTIDPESYRRYDPLASLASSMDAQAVADAYRTIQPRLDEAYRALGRSEGTVDQALGVALQNLINTPSPIEPVQLVHGQGATYAYAAVDLENALPVQKQLMRMGPAHVERVRSRLREIRAALETTAGR
jgi:hypothetical protein